MDQRCVRAALYVLAAPLLGSVLLFNTSSSLAQNMPMSLTDMSAKPADPSSKVPSFDVASIKENKGDHYMMSIMTKPDGFESVNISLKNLIANAYNFNQDLVFGGPNWAESKGFDINAKVAGQDVESLKKLTPRQQASMLQALLIERFHLKVHTETKVLPTYDLIVAKGGPKMKRAAPDPSPTGDDKNDDASKNRGMMTMGPGTFTGEDLPLSSVAGQLAYIVHHTVNDKTGLTDKYDLSLKFTSEDNPHKDDGSTDAPPPSIFTAVQEQLGLKLVSTKGLVETLVIDHAELPSEN